MSVITFFGREYTGAGQLAKKAADIWGYRVVKDRDVIEAAARQYGLEKKDIQNSIFKDPPFADRFSCGKAKCIAAVKSVLSHEVKEGQVIFSGFVGELIPAEIGLHILVTASENFRRRRLSSQQGNSSLKAVDRIHQSDESFLRWSLYLKTMENRLPSDYDGVVNVSRTGQSQLIDLIHEAAARKREEMDPREFRLAAKVSRVMAEKGHQVFVAARGGQVDLKVIKPVMMLARYGKKLSALARSVDGVSTVRTQAGPKFYRADIFPGLEFVPSQRVSYQSIERAYEQLYAQVADCERPFLYRQVEDRPSLACGIPTA